MPQVSGSLAQPVKQWETVADEGRSMAAKVEANVCTAFGVFKIVCRARKVGGSFHLS